MLLKSRFGNPTANLFSKKWLGRDLLAGFVVFLVAIPTSLGMAQAVGVPLASGILAGIIGGIVVGLLSGSQTSVTGPSPGLVGLLIGQLALLGSFEALLVAILIAGLIQVGFGLAGAGYLALFIPSGLVSGLLAAMGVILFLKQIPHLVGHHDDPEGEMSFWQPDRQTTFSELAEMTGDYHLGAAVIGISSVILLMLWDTRRPKRLEFLPGTVLVLGIAALFSWLFRDWGPSWAMGQERLLQMPIHWGMEGVHDLVQPPLWGTLWDSNVDPSTKQTGKAAASVGWDALRNSNVYLSGLLIAIVASLETMLNLQAVDQIDTRRRRSPVNRELVAQGIGNATCGLLGGLPMTSLVVHSAIDIHAGGQTKRASIFHGIFFLFGVLLLPQWLGLIPLSALAAVFFVTGLRLIKSASFGRIWADGWVQFIPFATTLVAIVFTDLLWGVLIGLAVSIGFILHSNMRRPLRRIVEKHLYDEVFHIELAQQVSFLSRGVLDQTLTGLKNGTHVMLDATDSEYIDPDILTMIKEFRDFTAPQRDIKVSLKGFSEKHELKDEIQYVDYSSRELQSEISPAQVLEILRDGNERFRTGQRLPRDLQTQIHGSAVGQFPLAVVLSCIDSRNPIEIILDLGLGDVFSVRVAGNIVGPGQLGSMEYSTAVAGAKLILVMGHTSCGAVNAAVALAHASQDYEQATGCQNLAPIVDQIKKSIDYDEWKAKQSLPIAEMKRFGDEVSKQNVLRVLHDILEQSRTIKRLVENRKVALVGAMYDVSTGQIEFLVEQSIGLDATKEKLDSLV